MSESFDSHYHKKAVEIWGAIELNNIEGKRLLC